MYMYYSGRCDWTQHIFRRVAKRSSMAVDAEDVIEIGDDLLERYPDAFTGDFERNRHRVQQLAELRSRHVCNRVAGYITRQYDDGRE